ncbi:MAG: DUF1700 domain-containing protein [Firmicutes bacterium]|nr:DUF1700 domain-containing protein [Bacillota bacterium]
MDKRTFLDGLRTALVSLPASEIDKTVAYYEEMIDDRIEDGMSEEEAVASMEPIGVLAQRIINDTPAVNRAVRKAKQSSVPAVIWVLLAILGLPIWLPLMCLAFGLIISVFALLFGLIISLIAIVLGLSIGGIVGIVFALCHLGVSGMSAVFAVGLCLIGIGLGILLAFPIAYLIKGIWSGIKALGRKIGSLFTRQEAAK